MSKHQTCRECRCSFVGPDSGIGDNLCDSCNEELHGECHRCGDIDEPTPEPVSGPEDSEVDTKNENT